MTLCINVDMSESESVKRGQFECIPKMQFIGMKEKFIKALLPTIGLDRGLGNMWSTPNLNQKNIFITLPHDQSRQECWS